MNAMQLGPEDVGPHLRMLEVEVQLHGNYKELAREIYELLKLITFEELVVLKDGEHSVKLLTKAQEALAVQIREAGFNSTARGAELWQLDGQEVERVGLTCQHPNPMAVADGPELMICAVRERRI